MALRDEGTYPMRFFVLIKKVRDGKYAEKKLGIRDIIYQIVMSMFSWTIPIQFLPKSGRYSIHA